MKIIVHILKTRKLPSPKMSVLHWPKLGDKFSVLQCTLRCYLLHTGTEGTVKDKNDKITP